MKSQKPRGTRHLTLEVVRLRTVSSKNSSLDPKQLPIGVNEKLGN